jgi:hypothetical protein
MMQKRRIAIAVGAAVLVAGVVAGRERPAIELVETRAAAVQSASDGIDLEKLRRNEATPPLNDPFAMRKFAPRQEPRPVQEAEQRIAARDAEEEQPEQRRRRAVGISEQRHRRDECAQAGGCGGSGRQHPAHPFDA